MALLDDDTVTGALAQLDWQRCGNELVKAVKCGNFSRALAYVNEVANLAEQSDHHPDIDIRWDTVTLRLSTHSEGGLTQRDLDLALAIDTLAAGG
ncbi:MAG: 4a-hydroxytetrahydrobiopterin dehydratase [Acidimicrobiales bacterium]